jgi:Ca2+-binding EF-hand superfamily protein
MSFKKPAVRNLDSIFDALDVNHNGRIDGLTLLGGLAATSSGSEEARTRFLFELCDFNMNGNLNSNEMILMIQCACEGILRLLQVPVIMSGNKEEENPFVVLVAEAFERMDSDRSGTLGYNEFVEWARSNREIMNRLRTFNEKVVKIAESQPVCETAPPLPQEEATVSSSDYENECQLHPELPSYYYNPKSPLDEVRQQSEDESAYNWRTSMIDPYLGGSKEERDRILSIEAPSCNLDLEWVYGYRSFDCRNNIRYIKNGKKLVYFAGTLGIVYSIQTHRQSFYSQHTGDIISMATHPTKQNIVVTGQTGDNPAIHIWEADKLTNISTIFGYHKVWRCFLLYP